MIHFWIPWPKCWCICGCVCLSKWSTEYWSAASYILQSYHTNIFLQHKEINFWWRVSHCLMIIEYTPYYSYILEQLSHSIRNRTDVHFCMYFSLFEWFHPLFLYDQQNNFTTRKYPEVKYPSFSWKNCNSSFRIVYKKL